MKKIIFPQLQQRGGGKGQRGGEKRAEEERKGQGRRKGGRGGEKGGRGGEKEGFSYSYFHTSRPGTNALVPKIFIPSYPRYSYPRTPDINILAPSHPRTLAPSHPRINTLAPSHQYPRTLASIPSYPGYLHPCTLTLILSLASRICISPHPDTTLVHRICIPSYP